MAEEPEQQAVSEDVRVASIEVEIWLNEHGRYCTAAIEGMNEAEAVGYLYTILDELKDEARGLTVAGIVVEGGYDDGASDENETEDADE